MYLRRIRDYSAGMDIDIIDTGPEPHRRNVITFRLLPEAKTRLEEIAHKHSMPGRRVSISDVIRASLAVAANHPAELDKATLTIRDRA